MANTKSALKRVRQNTRRTERHQKVRSKIRTYTNKLDLALEAKNVSEAEVAYQKISSVLDGAAKKNVIPKERASRRKSRMAKQINAIR